MTYRISDFDYKKVKGEVLCAVIAVNFFSDELSTSNMISSSNSALVGIGIGKEEPYNRTSVTIGGRKYIFNSAGNAYNKAADGYCIKFIELNYGSSRASTEESNEQSPTTETASEYTFEYRTEQAFKVLSQLLQKIENPTELSDNEIYYYCQQAYRWADKMLLVGAD